MGQGMKQATLTFDNGPEPVITPRVLDILAKHDVHAIFFFTGAKSNFPERLDIARRARSAGHRIGAHTWFHELPVGLLRTKVAVEQEILGPLEHLAPLMDEDRLFRPFGAGGNINTSLLNPYAVELLRQSEQTCVLWNCVPRDWEGTEEWVDRGLQQMDQAENPVILIHDYPSGAMDYLESFIVKAKDAGWSFTTQLPSVCLPILRGIPQRDLGDIVNSKSAE